MNMSMMQYVITWTSSSKKTTIAISKMISVLSTETVLAEISILGVVIRLGLIFL